jgi:adenylate cyclase
MEKNRNARTAEKTILIVDDELGTLEVLEFILDDAGFSVKAALNGREALLRLDEGNVDLVILDYMMPVLDGHHVIEAMRINPKYSMIPIILTSALPESTVRSRTEGYQVFLRKPYKTEPLMEAVFRLLDCHNET